MRALSATTTKDVASDIVFHMTDWRDELGILVDIFLDPDGYTDKQIEEALSLFLIHAPAHIAAAAKLYTGAPVIDLFEVGAVSSEPPLDELESS